MSFQENDFPYLDKLNSEQKAACLCTEGPVMIIAGAGSGKTRVLTYRIAHLIRKGIDAFNILSLTFTNKAAREMKERIQTVTGNEAMNLWMGTFHSVFAKILRIESQKLGYTSNFTIYDTDDAKSLVKTIIKELNLDEKQYKHSIVYNKISSAKNNLITADKYSQIPELTEADNSMGRSLIYKIFEMYEKRCFQADAMDFDDLLINTYKLLSKHIDVLNKYQHKFKYIMVDEYQDTNLCQYMIVKKLAAAHRNLCVVGDDSQSIYSFRGANIQNILNFEKDYPELNVFKLEHNYRSSSTIVEASSCIISKNKEKLDKKIFTNNPPGEKIKIIKALSDNEEGKFIAQEIHELSLKERAHYQDFAILYRTNAQSRSFEEQLRKLDLPYRIYGGMSFYQRKEVKDMLAYLRVVVNPKDEEALKRIINYPARKIGQSTIDKLLVLASQNQTTIWNIISKATSYPDLGASVAHLKNFYFLICSFQTLLETKNAYQIADYISVQSGIIRLMSDDKTVEGISRQENLNELLNSIKEFSEDDTSEVEKTLPNFLQSVALYTDADKDNQDKNVVSLMTVHSSKGLEFKYVFVVGLEENLFPGQMSLNSRQELEEERRLFYVASTRAEKNLFYSYATSRFRFGNLIPCEPSRFLDEIDPQYLNTSFINSNLFSEKKLADNSTSGSQFGKGFGMNVGKKIISLPNRQTPVNSNFVESNKSLIKKDCLVEHIRFGKGKVIEISGNGDDAKAIINFEETGEKTLVLKFAKLMILEE